jgi:hypothetical protein
MSTRVIATVKLTAACRHDLREQLGLSVDPASELSRLDAIIGSRQLTVAGLRQLISTATASSVLSALAAAEFSRVRARLEGGSRSVLETTAADLQAELAETLAVAAALVAAATRGMTADILAESGRELGYAATTHHSDSATCIELRRGPEIILVGIHDGGNVEFDHGGFTGYGCGEHQLELELAAERRGVFITQRL